MNNDQVVSGSPGNLNGNDGFLYPNEFYLFAMYTFKIGIYYISVYPTHLRGS